MVELLAPAGKMENLKFAFLYGADAVYFGGQNYSLRANAKNFNLDEIKEATIYAHSLNKKVYVTVNIVFHDEDFLGLDDYLRYLDEINVDGIIASDISVQISIATITSSWRVSTRPIALYEILRGIQLKVGIINTRIEDCFHRFYTTFPFAERAKNL